MKISKKTKVTREITKQERNRRNNIRRITVSGLVALILFIALTIIQSSILNQEEKKVVIQVISDISSGTKITDENFNSYFGTREVAISLIPEDYITDREVIINKFVNRNYKAKDIITTDGITDTEELYTKNIVKPTEISFATDSLSTAVAGILREGDYINIYGIRRQDDSDLLEVDETFTFKHVYVVKAFDGSGNRILNDNTDEVVQATMFSLILDEDDVELFNEMVSNCTIRLAKVTYDTDTDYQEYLNRNTGDVERSTTVDENGTRNTTVDYNKSNDSVQSNDESNTSGTSNNTTDSSSNNGEYFWDTDENYDTTSLETTEATGTDTEASENNTETVEQ